MLETIKAYKILLTLNKDKTMNTPEWIEYTGSDKQIAEMLSAANKHGVMIIHHNGELCPAIFTDANELYQHLDKRTKYPIKAFLLCQPHPCADLIKIWADTGCPVYWRVKGTLWKNEFDGHTCGIASDIVTIAELIDCDSYDVSITPFED